MNSQTHAGLLTGRKSLQLETKKNLLDKHTELFASFSSILRSGRNKLKGRGLEGQMFSGFPIAENCQSSYLDGLFSFKIVDKYHA